MCTWLRRRYDVEHSEQELRGGEENPVFFARERCGQRVLQ
jgi:hypothetical protein